MGQFNVEIEERDFSGLYPIQNLDINPVRYRRSVLGGCIDAEFTVKGAEARLMELANVLRCPIKIYYDNQLVWWGYISGVEIVMPGYALELGLDDMANRVAVTYSLITTTQSGEQELGERATTDWAEDLTSQANYGIKELIVSAGGMNATQANAARDRILGIFSKPIPKITFGKNEKGGKIYAKGWWDTLNWKYYANTNTTTADITTILAEIIANGAFITGVTSNVIGGINCGRYRDGSLSIMDEALKLMENGTNNYRRLLVDISPERNAIIYEEPPNDAYYAELLIFSDGTVLDRFGNKKAIYKCPTGLAVLDDIYLLSTGNAIVNDPRVIFIEEAEYSVNNGYLPIARGSISPWDIIERFTG